MFGRLSRLASPDKTPQQIAAEFAEIPFDDHEAKILALGFIDLQGRLSRIHAAAEHDADMHGLPALREFLMRESDLCG
jgi:hypothetical protein